MEHTADCHRSRKYPWRCEASACCDISYQLPTAVASSTAACTSLPCARCDVVCTDLQNLVGLVNGGLWHCHRLETTAGADNKAGAQHTIGSAPAHPHTLLRKPARAKTSRCSLAASLLRVVKVGKFSVFPPPIRYKPVCHHKPCAPQARRHNSRRVSIHSPLQRRVLLNVLPVLIQGGGTNALQLTTRQGGLQDVGCINGSLSSTSTDQGVHLINHLHRTGASRTHRAHFSRCGCRLLLPVEKTSTACGFTMALLALPQQPWSHSHIMSYSCNHRLKRTL